MNKFLAFFFTFTLASSVWAFQVPPQPEKCPGVAAIHQTSFMTAKKLTDGSYGAIQLSNYDTKDVWAFIVAEITAASAQEALNKATAALSSLTYSSGPTYFSENNIWACLYNVDAGYLTVALTPLPSSALNTESVFKATKLH